LPIFINQNVHNLPVTLALLSWLHIQALIAVVLKRGGDAQKYDSVITTMIMLLILSKACGARVAQ
jgi:hypothetical protein